MDQKNRIIKKIQINGKTKETLKQNNVKIEII